MIGRFFLARWEKRETTVRRRNVATAGLLSFGLYRVAPFAAHASTWARTWTLNEFREPPSPPRLIPRGFPFSSRDLSRWRACIRATCAITMLSSPQEAPYIPRFMIHRRRSAASDCPREATWPDLPENLLLFLVHYRYKSALQRRVEMFDEIVHEILIGTGELEYSILNLIREEKKSLMKQLWDISGNLEYILYYVKCEEKRGGNAHHVGAIRVKRVSYNGCTVYLPV